VVLVRFCFDELVLDTALRELRYRGEIRHLQPQAFSVLEYLIRHRERAVSKQELLEKLWPDAVVGEGSVQRAVSLARAAIDDDGTRLHTIPRHGYRFVAPVQVDEEHPSGEPPRPRFARSGDVHIAYCTLGDGDLDIVIVPGWVFPMQAFFDHPDMAQSVYTLAQLGRVILFDKRGTGLSDRVKELPTLEQRMDDLRAVLDAADSQRAVLLGYSEGGPLCLLYATSYPERTRGLVLAGAFARWTTAPGHRHGWTPEFIETLRRYIRSSWGAGETIRAIAQSRTDDPEVAAWAARAEQQGASPGAALELLEMNLQVDVRPILPTVSVPTAVVHHESDPVIPIESGRYLATHIPLARFSELEGVDHVFAFENTESVAEAVTWVADQEPRMVEAFLTTILVAEVDDALDPEDTAASFRGVRDGHRTVWSFDGPQRAILCAHALLAHWAARRKEARVGIHTGEVTRGPGGLSGRGVDFARALALHAKPGQALVSGVVRDLVHGAALAFAEGAVVSMDDETSLPTFVSVPGGTTTVSEREAQ
jgi:pimeloyl-ACP methyl ester carboxylesterase